MQQYNLNQTLGTKSAFFNYEIFFKNNLELNWLLLTPSYS